MADSISPSNSPGSTALWPAHVLHVDDDEANRYAVTRSLVRAGFKVTEAGTGAEALSLLTTGRPVDLIILDVRLPDIDGFEMCRRVKADPATHFIPVLHLSANFISSEDKAHGLNGGADAYLIRPVAPVELIATVNALLRILRAEEGMRAARDEAILARAAAETANRIKDEFLATLSHELRTPLTAIVGWANILQRGRASPAEHMEGLRTIERNAKAQAKLIEDLLDVSRIISGKLRLETQRVDANASIDAAIEVIRPNAEVKGLTLDRVAPTTPLFVNADPARLQQVVDNLLGNAVKFTPENGTIRVAVRRADGSVELTVSDTGQGIAPEFLPHIFERFRQADISSRRSQGGLGLGLAIVRQLIELHGGSIRAESAGAGKGATFIVRLPEAESSLARSGAISGDGLTAGSNETIAANAKGPAESQEPLNGVSVLVIEDDADCRSLAARVIEGCGGRVVEVASVAAAFEALAVGRFDVVVSDIGMPVEDGYDFIRRLRAMTPAAGGATPALALSAFAQIESQQKMLASGFNAFLAKPVEPQALCNTIAKLVERVTSPANA